MVRTEARASARVTTLAPERTRVARPRMGRTVPAASLRRTTPALEPTPRPDRDRTCTEAGDRPPSNAATTGRRPIATPTTGPATRRVQFVAMKAMPSCVRALKVAGWRPVLAETSMPARTATCIARTVAPGRSTTTADGRTRQTSRLVIVPLRIRPIEPARPIALPIDRRQIN